MRKITIALALLVMLSAFAVVTVSGAEPREASADSVQLLRFGENALICVNCPAAETTPDADFRQATLAASFPRITCKNNEEKPCVIYTGLKYRGLYNAADYSPENQPYAIAAEGNYEQGKPLSKGNLNFALDEGQLAVYVDPVSMEKSLFRVESPHKLMLVNAKLVIDNSPGGLSETLPEAEQETAGALEAGEQGRILRIEGLAKNAPNQMIDSLAIPLKLGDRLTFTGIKANKEYSLERPVLSVGLIAGTDGAEDWLDELNDRFKDSGEDRSMLNLCGKEFMNYYAGSAFEIEKKDDGCIIPQYLLNTALFEDDDTDDNKLFTYVCGDIVFEAVGGNARNLYCNQEDIHNALLSCGIDGRDEVCTGANGKTKIKIRLEPGAFEVNNRQQTDTFQSVREVTSGEQKAYHFLTKRLKLLTHPQSRTPLRYDAVSVTPSEEKLFVVTYKDSTAMGANTITLPEWSSVFRLRGRQRFAYHLQEADYKGVLGEGLHQINLIYPEGLARNEETSTAISEARMRGATMDNIPLLGAAAKETIDISRPNVHNYIVTPMRPGQEASAVEAQSSQIQMPINADTTLGDYAYRYCFRQEPPSEFRGAAREAAESVAGEILERNQQLRADANDILNTPIPAGTVLEAPETVTTYRLNRPNEMTRDGIVHVRLMPEKCIFLHTARSGESCYEKPGSIVKCVPESRQSQCVNVYNPGGEVKECALNNVCCEVDLSEAEEYCVLPEQGEFLSSGAKCSAMCRNEVSPADYGRIDVERVRHCAGGLTCCKSTRRAASAAETPARAEPAAAKDDSACTSAGGTCADIRNSLCVDTERGVSLSFTAGKCLSNRASWWQCCPGEIASKGTEQTALQIPARAESEEVSMGCAEITKAQGFEGQCRDSCSAAERQFIAGMASGQGYAKLCDGGQQCCIPEGTASAETTPAVITPSTTA